MKSDFIGGAMAVGAAFASIFGVNLQKYSHDKEELRANPRPYHLRPMWWVGMVCVVAASLGDFLALGFASQTLVASLGGGSTILGNALLSRFWLKQSLYLTDVIGVGLVTLGVVILAAASEEEEGHYKMEQIYSFMQAATFILYCFVTTAFVMTLYMRVRRSKAPALRVASTSASATSSETTSPSSASEKDVERIKLEPVKKKAKTSEVETDENPADEKTQEAPNSGCKSALMSPFPSPVYGDSISLSPTSRLPGEEDDNVDPDEVAIKLQTPMSKAALVRKQMFEGEVEKHSLIIDPKLPLYWAAISGTIGAQSVLLAKCVAEMISSSLTGDNQFKYFGTYVLVGGMVMTLLTQTHTLNMATMTGDTMSAYPVFQAFWITFSNISGVVFFQQTHNFTSTQWMMFPMAIACVFIGIYLVSKHEKYGNNVKYSVALPISLGSPRQHSIVAQSFVFRVMTPQRLQEDFAEDNESGRVSPRRTRRMEAV
ncbi:TPA: hypothetical protein N0F65_003668 [Lagenidium giganteum]|uniref:Magnesium transporter n=1 Tax=Lagenidium giganteum TaxID=4803 RepID=A0AAV2YIZ7_9STRA|nr:TPA: hypothetical protein N0F65_003668 [Lagenidium giganteum]